MRPGGGKNRLVKTEDNKQCQDFFH
jgi:hypothetical protein